MADAGPQVRDVERHDEQEGDPQPAEQESASACTRTAEAQAGHCQSLYCSRSRVLRNLPVDVRGMASTNS